MQQLCCKVRDDWLPHVPSSKATMQLICKLGCRGVCAALRGKLLGQAKECHLPARERPCWCAGKTSMPSGVRQLRPRKNLLGRSSSRMSRLILWGLHGVAPIAAISLKWPRGGVKWPLNPLQTAVLTVHYFSGNAKFTASLLPQVAAPGGAQPLQPWQSGRHLSSLDTTCSSLGVSAQVLFLV